MGELVKPHHLDAQALKSLQDVVDLLNKGIKDGNVAGPIAASKLRRVIVKKVTVGAALKKVRHNLGAKPGFVFVTMTSAGAIRKPLTPKEDANFVYLVADAGGRTADICIVE